MNGENYDNLQEIIERFIIPCNRYVRDVISHKYFFKGNNLDEVYKALENEKTQNNAQIPYKFAIVDKYP